MFPSGQAKRNPGINMPLRCKIWKLFFKMQRHQPIAVGAQMIPALLLIAAKSLRMMPQHRQIHHQLPQTLEKHCAAETVLAVNTPALLARGNDFTGTMSQQPLIDMDMNGFDNTEAGPTLDDSVFDELFQNVERNNDLI
jgi:hypothetical protein